MQKMDDSSAAATAAAAAARVVLARTLGRLELRVNSFFVEALVVEFALLGVAQDVERLAEPLEDLGLAALDLGRLRRVTVGMMQERLGVVRTCGQIGRCPHVDGAIDQCRRVDGVAVDNFYSGVRP